jgi:hypothetical protein
MEPIKLLVILVLAATVVSLGVALYQLARGGDNSGKMLRSLTVRVVLSVALFVLLMIAWRLGLIRPHGVAN